MAVTLGEVFYSAAAIFQLGLVVVLATRGRITPLRLALILILLMNSVQLAIAASWLPYYGTVTTGTDGIILGSIAYALTQVPRPPDTQRGRTIAGTVAVVALILWVALTSVILVVQGEMAINLHQYIGLGNLRDHGFIAALIIGIFYTLPRLASMPADKDFARSSILAIAFLLSPLGVGPAMADGADGFNPDRSSLRTTIYSYSLQSVEVAMAILLLAFFAQVFRLGRTAASGDRWNLLVLGLVFGLAMGLITAFSAWAPAIQTRELTAQTARPVLFAAAMMLMPDFSMPRRVRRPLLYAVAAMAILSLFFGSMVLIAGVPLSATSLPPEAAIAGAILIGALLWALRNDLIRLAGLLTGNRAETNRMERYRAALTAHAKNPEQTTRSDLQRLRRRFHITTEEHHALVSLMEGNVMVPVAAVHGMRPRIRIEDRYDVIELLGEGGQGRVAKARDLNSGQTVVLKEALGPWKADAAARTASLRRESSAMARVDSPYVAKTIDVIETPWQTYLVREFIDGDTLEALITRHGPPPLARALAMAGDLFEGLHAMHAASLSHLDVKPSNTIMGPDGTMVLIDPGAAEAFDDAADLTAPLVADQAMSLRWAAPERLLDPATGGPASDLYEAAGTAFYAMTAKLPLNGPDDPALRADAWPSGLSKKVRNALIAARALDADKRPASAQQVLAALGRKVSA